MHRLFGTNQPRKRQLSAQPEATLDGLLNGSQLSPTGQKQFIELGWRVQPLTEANNKDCEDLGFYFHHYHDYCAKAPAMLGLCNHRHVCEAIQLLRTGRRKDCEQALLQLLPDGSSGDIAAKLIDFTAKATLFIDVTDWTSTETLQEFVCRNVASRSAQMDDFRLSRAFNARTFANVAGINVQWTRNLAEHLEVKGSDSDIAIFHCVTVLELYSKSELGKIFPAGFLQETERTLALMIPAAADRPTKSWFRSELLKRNIDPRCGNCRHLKASERHLRDFEFWKDRIIIVKEVFDEHQPRSVLQAWRDNRNPVQWWTFWIAIVVFLLTVLACVEGALQVYKAYHPSP